MRSQQKTALDQPDRDVLWRGFLTLQDDRAQQIGFVLPFRVARFLDVSPDADCHH
jgi:hypothetical protein